MRPLATLLSLAAALPLPAAAATVRLGQDVVPVRQSVELRVDPRSDAYEGSVSIELEVRRPASRFALHAEEMTLRSVTLDGAPAAHASGEGATIVITPRVPLKAGRSRLEIAFSNEFDRRSVGLYKMTQGDAAYVFTQFESVDARKAFPCFDEPGFKIPYQLTVATPAALTAVSNTPVAEATEKDGWRTTRFAVTRPVPSYLVALAVGEFDIVPVEGLGVPGRILTPKGEGHLARVAARMAPPLLKAAEAYFGQPYPYEKLDLIAVPEYWPGAMEHPGAITFAEGVLLLDEATSTPAQRRTLARIAAHEFAHQWFGNLVTMAWWDDLWLNETFAEWLGDRIAEQVHPELGVHAFELQPIQRAMANDSRSVAVAVRRPVSDPNDALRSVGLAYNKGKAVLGMFERWLGPERFRDGVRRYLKQNAWGNATSAAFWTALDAASQPGASAALASFIEQPGLPLVSVERTGPATLRLRQRRLSAAGASLPAQSWQVPVALRYSDGITVREKSILLQTPELSVSLEGAGIEWIFPDAAGAGYYRWHLGREELGELAAHAQERLTPVERIALLGNAAALLEAGEIGGPDYLEVLSRLAADPQPEVVSAALDGLKLHAQPLVSDAAWPAFAAWVRRCFGPALDRFGFAPQPAEALPVTLLRPDLLVSLGETGDDPRVLAFARDAAARLLADPASVDASVVGAVLKLNALTAGEPVFEEYRRRLEAARVPADRSRYVAALGGFRSPELRAKALAYAISGALRPNELIAITQGYTATSAGRDLVFDWVTANYTALSARIPPQFLASMPLFASGCEPERVEKARAFFGAEGRSVEGTTRTLARLSEQVGECAALRSREAAAVGAWLAGPS